MTPGCFAIHPKISRIFALSAGCKPNLLSLVEVFLFSICQIYLVSFNTILVVIILVYLILSFVSLFESWVQTHF